MTPQEAKQQLEAVRIKYREYILARDKAEQFRGMITSPTAGTSDGQRSESSGNGSENKIISLLWYSEQADRLFQDYMILRTEAELAIDFVKFPDEREVLTRRYIMYQKWETIAEIMGYSRQHITRIHESALKHISENF